MASSFKKKIRKRVYKILNRSHFIYSARFYMIFIKPQKDILDTEAYNNYNSKADIPPLFVEENKKIQWTGGDTWNKVQDVIKFIRTTYGGGTSLGKASEETLKIMIKGEGGVCGDYSQIFINFCILNDIKVREWGVHDKIYHNTVGHVFNEVFLPETGQWVCVDVIKAIYFVNSDDNGLLSTADIIDMVSVGQQEKIKTVNILDFDYSKLGTPISTIYLNHTHLFFLVTSYKLKTMDKALKNVGLLPIPLVHLGLILRGKYYKYMLYINSANEHSINEKIKSIGKKYKSIKDLIPVNV